jgi:hypothetical protein
VKSRPPEWALSLALSAASALLFFGALAALELGLRRYDPDYFYELYAEESSNVYSEAYGWELRRGFRGVDFGRIATVNAQGYRGPAHPHAKPPGVHRVVMFGDSIAYGAGVEDGETFAAQLEAMARGRREVVNLAVGGYGTDQALLRLEREGLRYQPDVVMLHFCLFSDYVDNALDAALFDARQPKPRFTLEDGALVLHDAHVRLSSLRRVSQWLVDESHVYNRLVGLLHGPRAPRAPGVWIDRRDAVLADLGSAADLTFHLVRRMKEVSERAGARFFFVIHPDRFAYKHRSKLMRKMCRSPLLDGIPVIDLGPRYRERGHAFEEIAFDEPGHLTLLGHTVAAETMHALLERPLPPQWDYRVTCADEPAPGSPDERASSPR